MIDEKAINEMKEETGKAFDELKKKREELITKGKEFQTQLNQLDIELIRLQGEYRSIEKMAKKSGVKFNPKVEKKSKVEKSGNA